MIQIDKEDLIGDLKDIPIEIVQRMVECQVEQGNKEELYPFIKMFYADVDHGGFDWDKTQEGVYFWNKVLNRKLYSTFFEKYSKDIHIYIKGVKGKDKEVEALLIDHGGINSIKLNCDDPESIYFLNPRTKKIWCTKDGSECSVFIKTFYEECFL